MLWDLLDAIALEGGYRLTHEKDRWINAKLLYPTGTRKQWLENSTVAAKILYGG